MFSDSENECDEINFDDKFVKSLLSFIDESEEFPDMPDLNQLSFSSGYSSEGNQLDSVVTVVNKGYVHSVQPSVQPKGGVVQSPHKIYKRPTIKAVNPCQRKLDKESLHQGDRSVVGHLYDERVAAHHHERVAALHDIRLIAHQGDRSVVGHLYDERVAAHHDKRVAAHHDKRVAALHDIRLIAHQDDRRVVVQQEDRRVFQGHRQDVVPALLAKNLLAIHCLQNVLFTGPCIKSYVRRDFQANVTSNPLPMSTKVPSSDPRTSRLRDYTTENRSARNALPHSHKICNFCFKNGEPEFVYMGHSLKTSDGIINCPILRRYVCEICGATGSSAHTRRYCSLNPEPFEEFPQFRKLSNGMLASSFSHK